MSDAQGPPPARRGAAAACARILFRSLAVGAALAFVFTCLGLSGGESAEGAVMATGALAIPASGIVTGCFGVVSNDWWCKFLWLAWPLEALLFGLFFCVVRVFDSPRE